MFDLNSPHAKKILDRLQKESREPVTFKFDETRKNIHEGGASVVKTLLATDGIEILDQDYCVATATRGTEIALAIIAAIEEQHNIQPIKPGELAIATQVSSLYLVQPLEQLGVLTVVSNAAKSVADGLASTFGLKMLIEIMKEINGEE